MRAKLRIGVQNLNFSNTDFCHKGTLLMLLKYFLHSRSTILAWRIFHV